MVSMIYCISLISTIVLAPACMAATTSVEQADSATEAHNSTTLAPTPSTQETTICEAITTGPPATKATPSESTTNAISKLEATPPDEMTPEATTPQRTTPQRTTPEATTPQRTTPQRTTPEATTPQRTTPQRTTPEATTPQRTTPQRTTPEATTPQRTTTEATTPQRTTPQATTRQATTHEATTPEATTPEATTPETTTPETSTPEATTPETSTPEITTPESTTPKPISTQTFGILDEDNKTYCIVLVGKFEFQIPYITEDGQDNSAIIPVPINHTVKGSCRYKGSDKAQQFILSFFHDWNVSVIIQQSPTVSFARRRLLAETVTYNWKHISLDYVIDENFPKAKDKGKPKTATTKPKFDALQSKKGNSYKCDADQTIHIDELADEDINLVLSNFQYTAFAQQANKTFENEGVTKCDADKKKKKDDDHVGAIVGGVFGGTVGIIIIIGIVMYCTDRGKHKDYVVM